MEQLVKIWCFNKAADLLGGKEKEIKQIFGENTEFAEREVMFRGELVTGRDVMARNDALKEYFVPIAVKCIGGLFDGSKGPARKQLDKIRSYYEKGGQPYKYYWDDSYYRAGMMTDSYQGYYSLIEEDTKRKADVNIEQKNILVGYSQGGLVARYLAYLDEYIFRPEGNGVVHGFITVAAPNLGSPVANENCRDHIAVHAIRTIMSLASLYGNGNTAFSELTEFISEPIKWEFFDNLIFKFRKGCVNLLKEGDDGAKEDATNALAAIEAVIRWTSGLRDDRKLTAFYDLSTFRLNKPHSVLAAVNDHLPKNILYGAVLSGNPRVDEFLHSTLGFMGDLALNHAKGRRLLGREFRENLEAAGDVYTRGIMRENQKPGLFDHKLIKFAYKQFELKNKDSKGNVIPPMSHDFIIPTVNQFILGKGPGFLGNFYNTRKPNHFSGGQRDGITSPGHKAYLLIRNILKKMQIGLAG